MNIDFSLYINLDFRTDRKDHMEKQLVGCSWPVERLSATRLAVSPESLGMTMHPRLVGHKGVASIWLSHKDALEKFSAINGSGGYLLLEDDVAIASTFWTSKKDYLKGLPSDWEVVLLSPRYRYRRPEDASPEEQGKRLAKSPNGDAPVFLPQAAKKYIITGAHFCIFRNKMVVDKVLEKLKSSAQVCDVDNFYVVNFKTYGIRCSEIGTAGFSSDHNV